MKRRQQHSSTHQRLTQCCTVQQSAGPMCATKILRKHERSTSRQLNVSHSCALSTTHSLSISARTTFLMVLVVHRTLRQPKLDRCSYTERRSLRASVPFWLLRRALYHSA